MIRETEFSGPRTAMASRHDQTRTLVRCKHRIILWYLDRQVWRRGIPLWPGAAYKCTCTQIDQIAGNNFVRMLTHGEDLKFMRRNIHASRPHTPLRSDEQHETDKCPPHEASSRLPIRVVQSWNWKTELQMFLQTGCSCRRA